MRHKIMYYQYPETYLQWCINSDNSVSDYAKQACFAMMEAQQLTEATQED